MGKRYEIQVLRRKAYGGWYYRIFDKHFSEWVTASDEEFDSVAEAFTAGKVILKEFEDNAKETK